MPEPSEIHRLVRELKRNLDELTKARQPVAAVAVRESEGPILELPGSLVPVWEDYQSYLTALTQTLGMPNRDQYLAIAHMATQLTLTASVWQLTEQLRLSLEAK